MICTSQRVNFITFDYKNVLFLEKIKIKILKKKYLRIFNPIITQYLNSILFFLEEFNIIYSY